MRKRLRLAVVTTHPIQYNAPLFRRLSERGAIDLRVFYGWEGAATGAAHDLDFGQEVRWDVPLLDGYAYEFVPNRAADPGSHHFRGIDTPELVPRVLSFQPDVVLVVGWNYLSHLRALRVFHGKVPILFRGDSTLLDEQPGMRRLARRGWLRYVYRHVDVALYVGERNRDYFQAHGLNGDRLIWAPHAVDNERFSDPAHDAEACAWRQSLGITPEAPTFVFAGKLEPNKAPEVLLEAFLADPVPGAHLIFVGSGILATNLRARAAGHPCVHFTGFCNQSRMPAAYRLGEFFVLPSRSETWGLAVNEAFASGRPAVVSNCVGCAPDLVLEGETGAVVPTGDVIALSAALARMAHDRTGQMGRTARTLISDWSLESLAKAVEGACVQACKATVTGKLL